MYVCKRGEKHHKKISCLACQNPQIGKVGHAREHVCKGMGNTINGIFHYFVKHHTYFIPFLLSSLATTIKLTHPASVGGLGSRWFVTDCCGCHSVGIATRGHLIRRCIR